MGEIKWFLFLPSKEVDCVQAHYNSTPKVPKIKMTKLNWISANNCKIEGDQAAKIYEYKSIWGRPKCK